MLALTAACVAAVLVAVWMRIGHASATTVAGCARRRDGARRSSRRSALAIFTLAGPLQHGWARRAGTPASLLGSSARAASARSSASSAASAVGVARSSRSRTVTGVKLKSPFTAHLTGTVKQTEAAGGAIVDLALT